MLADPSFSLVKKLIGKEGRNMKKIFEATQTRIRIRGRGSGYKEQNGNEAPVPLMIALSAEHGQMDNFRVAFDMINQLLWEVTQLFRASAAAGRATPSQLFWVGDIEQASRICLGAKLDGMLRTETIGKM
jgi:hypothetical protein